MATSIFLAKKTLKSLPIVQHHYPVEFQQWHVQSRVAPLVAMQTHKSVRANETITLDQLKANPTGYLEPCVVWFAGTDRLQNLVEAEPSVFTSTTQCRPGGTVRENFVSSKQNHADFGIFFL